MCCDGDLLTRGLLLLNASSVLLATKPLLQTRALRTATVALVFASALQLLDIWDLTFGFLRNFALVCLGICLFEVAPFVWMVMRSSRMSLEEKFPGKFRPLFFFCSTTHARFLPKKHTFKYPLLYVGFPVTMKSAVGGLFSVVESQSEKAENLKLGRKSRDRFTFFSIDPAGYTNPELPFEKKLESVLIHHGIDPSLYPFTYIVTTPRFFGYSFNPVSYYYLYSAQQELKLVVLEVNNTFGEKHLYILHSDNPANPPARKGYTFAGEMEKTFHISPFNHRSGSYHIQVRDPLDNFSSEGSRVDMHMVVHARDGTKSMVARAFSVSPSFDMVTGSTWRGLNIVVTWGYNTFLAVPETMYEAWKLYRKKAVVYTRPEVLVGSGQRDATKAERCRVETYNEPLLVTLTLPESNATKDAEVVTFQSKTRPKLRSLTLSSEPIFATPELTPPPTPTHLTVRVSNPRFFARYFSHQDPKQTIYLDITSQPDERKLAQINDLPLFQDILSPKQERKVPLSSWMDWRWKITSWWRRRKTSAELDSLPPEDTPTPTVYECSSMSTLDEHFFTADMKPLYRKTTMTAVLIDCIAFGEAESLELYEKIVRLFLRLCLVLMTIIMAMSFKTPGSFIMSARTADWSSLMSSLPVGTFALINGPLFWDAALSTF
ncbi:hypothetical protein DFP73DRAFT_570923 [Morchella snyderi]|nr:hypothetical protein DFP73DRAFT_570923 [Morchella snyderi]